MSTEATTRPERRVVLVVDDDFTILTLVRVTLTRRLSDVEVLTAANGEEGLEMLRRHRVDLVITDLSMPVMDGITFLSHVMEEFPQVPRVVMSSLGDGPREYAKQTGVTAVLTKPLEMGRLAEQVEGWLREGRTHSFLERLRLASFVQLIGMDGKTCTMGVRDMASGRLGMLYFRDGVLVDAAAGELRGRDAALLLLCWQDVQVWLFEYMPCQDDVIRTSLDWLLLEAARLADESGVEGLAARNRVVPTPEELRENRPEELKRAPVGPRLSGAAPIPKPEAKPKPDRRSVSELIDEAIDAFRAASYPLAKELWELAREKAPDNPVIRHNLAMVERCLAGEQAR